MPDNELPQWQPMPLMPMPFLFSNFLLLKHKFGIDAVYYAAGEWRFWYTGEQLSVSQLLIMVRDASHYMICKNQEL